MATDPAYRQRQLQYQRDYVKKRMQDPAYREMKMQRWREKYYNNPEFREKNSRIWEEVLEGGDTKTNQRAK